MAYARKGLTGLDYLDNPENKPDISKSRSNMGLSCEYINQDDSCREPEYAWCMAWTDWKHEHPERDSEEFCKLPEKQKAKYREKQRPINLLAR